MAEPSVEQIRSFRLRAHHLDTAYQKAETTRIVGACGMQNSPPGAWETALHNRVPDCGLPEIERLLYIEKSLLQAWSLRGAPFLFPTSESDVFLSSLQPEEGEPWIYTRGISGALDFLQMSLEEVFGILMRVIPRLDGEVISSKSALDQTLARWMLPLLPAQKRGLWDQPSMYVQPDDGHSLASRTSSRNEQTVGGAAVSFLLRPCSFCGAVVFGERNGISPTFTSYKSWTGHPLNSGEDAAKRLARKYLRCYGPATADTLTSWLGCSGKQGKRIWKTISEEIEPVTVFGKKAFILSDDRERLFSPASFPRELLLLGGHDPFLDQRDRAVLQPEKALHKQIWKLTANPGAILYRGEIIGIWTSRKKSGGMEIDMTLWAEFGEKQRLRDLAEEYAAFRQLKLAGISI